MTYGKHKDCGGDIVEDWSITYPTYNDDNNPTLRTGTIPAFRCTRCGTEILGDTMIELS